MRGSSERFAHRLPFLFFIILTLQSLVFASSALGESTSRHVTTSSSTLSAPSVTSSASASNDTWTLGTSATGDDEAEDMVRKALRVLAEKNKARVANPSFNKNEFAGREDREARRKPAEPLEVDSADSDSEASEAKRRSSDSDEETSDAYSIPEELASAAARVAESSPQKPSGDHASLAASIRDKYKPRTNDTNAPPQKQRPGGRLGAFNREGPISEGGVVKRQSSGYWMADMTQRGLAPYAPSGYKVWRNVKDYGAVGDGTTDDTAAIQKAIADGNRCGETCGSSTEVPAVVYFPPGTYLVSSSIIQYYNTQFLGDPHDVPTILAASSFVGLGVITSDPYVSGGGSWYINTANFLRSIRNFKIDIRLTNPDAYICAIHWQVAQATSLENIEFYMQFNTDVPNNTQQGIYMENGSGGYMADLTFVGGNFGAYFGNQQFTTSHLVFVSCKTGVQVHWDWSWTMQDFVFESCHRVQKTVDKDDVNGVGSMILVDSIVANGPKGIVASLDGERSTALLVQNVGFFNVETAVSNEDGTVLAAGGNQKVLESWGYGRLIDSSGKVAFASGEDIEAMDRSAPFLGEAYDNMSPNLFTRRRPKYYDLPITSVMNVRELGAAGDGKTDDTAVLNAILEGAANTSSVVHFPYGVYIVTDTLRVPIGSRIIGQAWSQIMGKGERFEDEMEPRAVVRVARPGDVGIIEIQDMMFTVSGPTAGAIVLEWNAQEQSQGSAGLWDSHVRVGGASGSNLQLDQCGKQLSGAKINEGCKAASLLVHLTRNSTAYIENMWNWVADHDLEAGDDQDQIDIYSGRGMLIESRLAYLWGTSTEHNVLYQYQLAGASNILMPMIQTESPYFQPAPPAPEPFTPGTFASDPTFSDCGGQDEEEGCASSWALRIVDSSSVYMLGAGVYSWFSKYSQDCVATDNCQQRAVEMVQSKDIWLYNLCTKGIVEMISPRNERPVMAADNKNSFLSSLLAWMKGSQDVTGPRDFPGFEVYLPEFVRDLAAPSTCKSALREKVECMDQVGSWRALGYRGSLDNDTLTDLTCQDSCGESLRSWTANVDRSCAGFDISGAPASVYGRRMWAGWNETCLMDQSGKTCNEVIDDFSVVERIEDMPDTEICSFCWVERMAMMQRTAHSIYDDNYRRDLEYTYERCGLTGDTEIKDPGLDELEEDDELCLSGDWYTAEGGETCEDVARQYTISSASLFFSNQNRIPSCSRDEPLRKGAELCVPASCGNVYEIRDEDTCRSIERNTTHGVEPGDVERFNPWVGFKCEDMQVSSLVYGSLVCLGPQWGDLVTVLPGKDTTTPRPSDGYVDVLADPPENAILAEGTTIYCGRWHIAEQGETCVAICLANSITSSLFRQVNPSLGGQSEDGASCTSLLEVGSAYCAGPHHSWEYLEEYGFEGDESDDEL